MNAKLEDALRDLIDLAKRANLEELSWKDEGMKIAFRRALSPSETPATADAPADAAAPAEEDEIVVRSPMVGTFRRGLQKDRPPVVMLGNHVKSGERLGVVECMKIPTDVVSFAGGEVKRVLVEDGQTVEYGQPLFVVTPADGANGER